MMGLTATKQASNFEMTPAGVHIARCYRLIDLGTQITDWQGQKKLAHKVLVGWELLGEERMADGRPFTISKRYTVSMHEKAQLRKDLEAWRGRSFTMEEEAQFDLRNILGQYCFLNVVHATKDGNEYSNIGSIMPLPKGTGKPEAVNAPQVFDIDDRDMTIFSTLGEKLKETIQSAKEWSETTSGFENMKDDLPWHEDDVSF